MGITSDESRVLRTLGRKLVDDVSKIAASEKTASVVREYAKVAAINGDGTLELEKGSDTYPMPLSKVRRTVGAEAKVGDVVVVETYAHVPLVTSIVSVDGETDGRITDAVNDAAEKADVAQQTADTATTAATAAQTTADAAATDAATAKTDATAAKSTANTANTAAKAAQTTATAAKTTADAASTTAATAKQTADTAASTATAASETADTAKQTADAASATATTAKTTADAAQATADTAKAATDSLQTLIRETSDGIEVGKSSDGETYSGTHTLVGTDAFEVHDEDHNELASFGATSASIGNGADFAKLQLGKLLSIESHNSESYIITGSSGYSDLHIGAIKTTDNFAGPQLALLKAANAVAAHGDYYYFYGGTNSLNPAMFTWERFRKKLLTHTYVGSKTVMLESKDSAHSTCVLFTAAQYKAITGVAFDYEKHNIALSNGDHDACADIWSMLASYSANQDNVHLMCMTSKAVSGKIRVNYTITIDAS